MTTFEKLCSTSQFPDEAIELVRLNDVVAIHDYVVKVAHEEDLKYSIAFRLVKIELKRIGVPIKFRNWNSICARYCALNSRTK